MSPSLKKQVLNLPVEERLYLMDELIESLANENIDHLLPTSAIEEIKRRVKSHKQDKSNVLTLEEMREKYWKAP